jgi:hypothetical protein
MRYRGRIIVLIILLVSGIMNEGMAQNNDRANKKLMIYQLLPRLFGNKQQNNVPYGTIEQRQVCRYQ